MPHFKEFLDPNFLANIDFIDDKMKYVKKIVTITGIESETAHDGKGGAAKTVTTLHFKECKKMILSNKNFKTILQMTKKVNTDDWKGMQLELYILENQKAFGSLWDVIRVSSAVVGKSTIKSVDYSFQIEQLRSCLTLEQLQATYLVFTADQKTATVSTKDECKLKLTSRDENKLL
jgi:hypothetical protein